MCNRCCIPCIRVASITTTATTATLTLATSIPVGRFDIVVGRNLCISPCADENVQIVAGGVTFTNVLNTSGNYLTLGQLSRFVRCGCRIRMIQTSNPAGNIMAIDVSCPGPNGVPIVNCGTSLLPVTASASLASPELDKSEAPAKK